MKFFYDREQRKISLAESTKVIKLNPHVDLYFEGVLFYYNNKNNQPVKFAKTYKNGLKRLIADLSYEDFINSVEGVFNLIMHDKKKRVITLLADKLKRKEVYYYADKKRILISNDLSFFRDFKLNLSYDQNALITTILMCLPKKQTIFNEIKRLRYNEYIHLDIKKGNLRILEFQDKDKDIADYGTQDLKRYNEILENAVLSRASKGLNIVQSSGGYDSTLILSILRKHFSKDKVRGVTFEVTLPDGLVGNSYEIAKIMKIDKYFGVKTDIVKNDYRKKKLVKILGDIYSELYDHQLFSLPTNHYAGAKFIRDKYGDDVTVFNGEGCDSLHNYGFSQFVSLSHTNYDFVEYADKMKSYLFGPTFFTKIKDATFKKDIIYRIFLEQNKGLNFVDVKNRPWPEVIQDYLLSFIISDIRLPFRRIDIDFINEGCRNRYLRDFKNEYFMNISERINERNLYYYYSVLYLDFHLQSSKIRRIRTSLKNARLPFIDLNLFRYLYKMPESFGRGLDFNRVKYPMKELINNGTFKYPIEVVKQGPHCYITETQPLNPYDEYLVKSTISDYVRQAIKIKKISGILDKDIFDIKKSIRFMTKYKMGQAKNLTSTEYRSLILFFILSNSNLCKN